MLLKHPNIKYLNDYINEEYVQLPLFDNTFKNQVGYLKINISTNRVNKHNSSNTRGYFFLGDLNISNNIIYCNDILSFIDSFNFRINPMDTFFIFSPGNILQADIDFLKSFNKASIKTFIRPKHKRLIFICKWDNHKLEIKDNGYLINSTFLPFQYSQTDLRNLLTRTNIKHL